MAQRVLPHRGAQSPARACPHDLSPSTSRTKRISAQRARLGNHVQNQLRSLCPTKKSVHNLSSKSPDARQPQAPVAESNARSLGGQKVMQRRLHASHPSSAPTGQCNGKSSPEARTLHPRPPEQRRAHPQIQARTGPSLTPNRLVSSRWTSSSIKPRTTSPPPTWAAVRPFWRHCAMTWGRRIVPLRPRPSWGRQRWRRSARRRVVSVARSP